MKAGDRVIVEFLHVEGKHPGLIVQTTLGNLATVQLDSQKAPVSGVLCYESEDAVPEVIQSNLWQFCYPESEAA